MLIRTALLPVCRMAIRPKWVKVASGLQLHPTIRPPIVFPGARIPNDPHMVKSLELPGRMAIEASLSRAM